MKKREAEFTTKFKKYLETNPPKQTTFYEIKIIKGVSFSLSTWLKKSPHQARSFKKISNKGLWHKLSDDSRGQKPFDSFYAINAQTKMVFYSIKEKEFVIVDAKKIIDLALSEQKSIKFKDIIPLS